MKRSRIRKNDPCPCGSGLKFQECCMRFSNEINLREIIRFYVEASPEFEKDLQERSRDEVSYDNVVLNELRSGKPIEKALHVAGVRYPDEALHFDSDTIGDITVYYDFLMSHEFIKQRIHELSN
ncbi:hypothetical protein GF337_02290 [candidate division KSB1 bacterium]|nr:hypothetical protein [candidate division KSB1 bacterium]